MCNHGNHDVHIRYCRGESVNVQYEPPISSNERTGSQDVCARECVTSTDLLVKWFRGCGHAVLTEVCARYYRSVHLTGVVLTGDNDDRSGNTRWVRLV